MNACSALYVKDFLYGQMSRGSEPNRILILFFSFCPFVPSCWSWDIQSMFNTSLDGYRLLKQYHCFYSFVICYYTPRAFLGYLSQMWFKHTSYKDFHL